MVAPRTDLAEAARAVLLTNDRGTTTVAAPALYPHQWSWDAAIVSLGWATFSVDRAITELRSLLAGQWRTGMIPHIVFSAAPGYFPGADRWQSQVSENAPTAVATSGICQPPVHGLAVHLIGRLARLRGGEQAAAFDGFVRETLDDWVAWHRWLEDARRDEDTGLIAIHHGWESGMDNSPRWDLPYSRMPHVAPLPYQRQDLRHVADPRERPTDTEYDRYIHLVDQLVGIGYDDRLARSTVDFRVGDAFVTALHALSADLLADLADQYQHPQAAEALRGMASRARHGVAASVDPTTGLARDRDLLEGDWLVSSTVGNLAPLVCGTDDDHYDALVGALLGPQWCGADGLALPVLPTTAPSSPAFVPSSYWRGPSWPVINWLFSFALQHHGRSEPAQALRAAGLQQLSDLSFAEYYHPLDARPLGSRDQSWTAAVALAWSSPGLLDADSSARSSGEVQVGG